MSDDRLAANPRRARYVPKPRKARKASPKQRQAVDDVVRQVSRTTGVKVAPRKARRVKPADNGFVAPAVKVAAKAERAASKPKVRREMQAERHRRVAVRDSKRAVETVARMFDTPKPKRSDGGGLIGAITGTIKVGEKLAPAVAKNVLPGGALVNAVDAVTHGRASKDIAKAAKNAPKDAAEIVVTTPSSLVKLGDTAIHDPKKVPGMLAQPYKDLLKDPENFFTEHPVSTALMVAPAAKIPGRAVGRGLRLAGKQTLERAPARLPHTGLRETRAASRDAVLNAVQKRADKRKGAPVVSKRALQRRVDEFYDFATQKRAQMEAGAHKQAKADFADLPKAQRKQKIAERVEGARKGAKTTMDQRFAKEFGATAYIDQKSGAIVKPKDAAEGRIHTSRADAERVAKALNAKPVMIPRGSKSRTVAGKLRLADNSPVPAEFKVRAVGKNQYAVLPNIARERLYGGGGRFGAQGHVSVGSGKQVMAKVMRVSRRQLTQAVLPTSVKWLGGQAGEAALRSAVSGAGPLDVLRVHRVVKALNRQQKHLGDEMLMRISGGQFGLTGPAREYAVGKRTLAEEFANTSLETPAHIATKAGQALPLKVARQGWQAYTKAVLGSINGAIENTARKAMAGHEIKQTLLDRSVIGLSDKAIDDAARGLRATESQVALARKVDRMYGQYQKFSPERRSLLLHWTPFLPWYMNVVTFLTKTLPVDHPMHAAVLAGLNATLEDWRKDEKLSLRGEHGPLWMMGSYPTKGGLVNVGRFTPFGITNPEEAAGSLALPQAMSPLAALAYGIDWKGEKLKGNRSLNAALDALGSQVPLASQAAKLTGLEAKVTHKPKPSARSQLGRMVNPLYPIPNTADESVSGVRVKVKPVKVRKVKVKRVKVR